MKRIVCLLISALLVSCSQTPTVVTEQPKVQINKEIISKDVSANQNIKIEPKVQISQSSEPISQAKVKEISNYIVRGVEKSLESLPSHMPTVTPTDNLTSSWSSNSGSSSSGQVVITSPSPTPIPTLTPSPSQTPEFMCPGGSPGGAAGRTSDNPNEVIVIMCSTPAPLPTKIPYKQDLEILDIRGEEAYYNLTFKDEYKVRYDKEKKQFYSLLDYDLKSVNDLFINQYININSRIQNYNKSIWTEEFMDNLEKEDQETGIYEDAVHRGSIYYLSSYVINTKELVINGRENKFVRELNVFRGGKTTLD